MIVRISGENQYRLPDEVAARLNDMENAVVATVNGGSEDDYHQAFKALLDYVRSNGEPIADDDLAGSDVIIPPDDLSFEEAGREFTGDGLIPD